MGAFFQRILNALYQIYLDDMGVCIRCEGSKLLTYDELTEEEKVSAGFGSVFPCSCCRLLLSEKERTHDLGD